MSEKPILFSAPMIKAILAGTKTVTRRLVKRPKGICENCFAKSVPHNGDACIFGGAAYLRVPACECDDDNTMCGDRVRFRAEPGQRLWVREAWRLVDFEHCDGNWSAAAEFKADGKRGARLRGGEELVDEKLGWRSSRFMPRWASRITLEVTSVRVERLQEISRDDAIAEGIEERPAPLDGSRAFYLYDERPHWTANPVESFRTLWDSLNADRAPWAANPFVWRVEFRRVAP